MELMRMLLLCAFASLLPQSLGLNGVLNPDIKINSANTTDNSLLTSKRHRQISSPNGQPIDAVKEVLSVFSDGHCKHCVDCMKRILRAQNNQTQNVLNHYDPEQLYYDKQLENFQFNRNERSIRPKRNYNNTETDFNVENAKSKSFEITKYTNEDGKIYALKVNEMNKQISGQNDAKSTCKVYSVKKTFSCGSGEADLILAKSKINKKGRKSKSKNRTTGKPRPTTAMFKKREVRIENSHVPESFMPSIEELY